MPKNNCKSNSKLDAYPDTERELFSISTLAETIDNELFPNTSRVRYCRKCGKVCNKSYYVCDSHNYKKIVSDMASGIEEWGYDTTISVPS